MELLHFAKDPADSEWYVAQLAVDGVLGVSFSIGVPQIHDLLRTGREQGLGEYLERQARNLIDRYGDARDPRPEPESEVVSTGGFHG